jgi:hypothetical protein
MFKRLLLAATIIVSAWLLLSQIQEQARGPASACDRPLTWRFGEIDPRFELDRDVLASVMHEVEEIWAEALDRSLLARDEEGSVVIEFVYDERQAQTDRAREALVAIDDVVRAQTRLEDDRSAALAHYEMMRRDYERELGTYNVRVARHNEAIAYWNDRGGAPAAEHGQLMQEREVIARHGEQVEALRREVERLREAANERIDRYNQAITARNELVDRFNTRFAGQRRFSQGEYRAEVQGRATRHTIRIFQFGDLDELRIVLAHEVGHALGLDHVENPASVMYYLMTDANVRGGGGLSEDNIAAVHALCGTEAVARTAPRGLLAAFAE